MKKPNLLLLGFFIGNHHLFINPDYALDNWKGKLYSFE
jgi:hypothetical protein